MIHAMEAMAWADQACVPQEDRSGCSGVRTLGDDQKRPHTDPSRQSEPVADVRLQAQETGDSKSRSPGSASAIVTWATRTLQRHGGRPWRTGETIGAIVALLVSAVAVAAL